MERVTIRKIEPKRVGNNLFIIEMDVDSTLLEYQIQLEQVTFSVGRKNVVFYFPTDNVIVDIYRQLIIKRSSSYGRRLAI